MVRALRQSKSLKTIKLFTSGLDFIFEIPLIVQFESLLKFNTSFRDLVQEQLLQITQGPKVGNEFNELNRLLEEKEQCEEGNLKKSLDEIVYPVPEDKPEESKKEENETYEDANTERELAFKAFLTTNESLPHEFLDEFLVRFSKCSIKIKKTLNGYLKAGR